MVSTLSQSAANSMEIAAKAVGTLQVGAILRHSQSCSGVGWVLEQVQRRVGPWVGPAPCSRHPEVPLAAVGKGACRSRSPRDCPRSLQLQQLRLKRDPFCPVSLALFRSRGTL